jgi:hypothetical protein
MAAVFALVVAWSHAVATIPTAIKIILHRWSEKIKKMRKHWRCNPRWLRAGGGSCTISQSICIHQNR